MKVFIEHVLFVTCSNCYRVRCLSGSKSVLDIRKYGWILNHDKTVPLCPDCYFSLRAKKGSEK